MRFLDRGDEFRRLDAAFARPGGFAAIWGRRRVGKTRLLVEWSKQRDGLYTVADASAAPVQRRHLAEAIAARFPGFADVEYPDWRSLLERVRAEAAASRWPGPLMLDELPYVIAADPSFVGVLQNWLDRPGPRPVLVVSGSSHRMMADAVLDSGAPLYGRTAEAFAVRPLRPGHLAEAFPGSSAAEQVSLHALWGGMPRYWELAAPFGTDLARAVDALVLDPAGPLHDEPDRLLRQEMPSAISLRPVLDVIGAGAHRLSEIAGRLGKPGSSLSGPLALLQEMEFALRETPFGSPPRSGKRSLYRLADPFLRLWFQRRGAAPRRPRGRSAGDPPGVLETGPPLTRSVRLGRTLPPRRADAPPWRLAPRRARPLGAGAALLARKRTGIRPRGPLRGRQTPPRRRSEVAGRKPRDRQTPPSRSLPPTGSRAV